MYHPPAFDFDSRIAIESRIPPHKRIIVDTEDAGNFACNAVNIDNKIIVNSASSHLKKDLSECGFEVTEVDLSEFLKAGGSAKCLTLKLVDGVFEIME
jgi:N-dimethylarginine dimethylaminohydrolase